MRRRPRRRRRHAARRRRLSRTKLLRLPLPRRSKRPRSNPSPRPMTMTSAVTSMNVAKRVSVVAIVLAGLVAGERAAHAQGSNAEALFKEGRALLDQKKYDEACPKLAESQKLDPGAGTLLALALCHEGQGKTATAKRELEEAAALGKKNGRDDLAKAALKRAAAMEPTLSKLVIRM